MAEVSQAAYMLFAPDTQESIDDSRRDTFDSDLYSSIMSEDQPSYLKVNRTLTLHDLLDKSKYNWHEAYAT